jgi:hypothetical protein
MQKAQTFRLPGSRVFKLLASTSFARQTCEARPRWSDFLGGPFAEVLGAIPVSPESCHQSHQRPWSRIDRIIAIALDRPLESRKRQHWTEVSQYGTQPPGLTAATIGREGSLADPIRRHSPDSDLNPSLGAWNCLASAPARCRRSQDEHTCYTENLIAVRVRRFGRKAPSTPYRGPLGPRAERLGWRRGVPALRCT